MHDFHTFVLSDTIAHTAKTDIRTKEKLRICFMTETFAIEQWQKELIQYLSCSEISEIVCIMQCTSIQKINNKKKPIIRNIFAQLFSATDRQLMHRKVTASKVVHCDNILNQFPAILIDYKNTPAQIIQSIQQLNGYGIDIIIDLNTKNFDSRIAGCSRYGIWYDMYGKALHHHPNTIGLNELLMQIPFCYVEIGSFTAKGHAILMTSRIGIHGYSCSLVAEACFRKSYQLFIILLFRVWNNVLIDTISEKKTIIHNCYKNSLLPSNALFLKLFFLKMRFLLLQKLKNIIYVNQWCLLLHRRSFPEFTYNSFQANNTDTSILSAGPDTFWADPHIIEKDSLYYLFFEEYCYKKSLGHICVATVNNEGKILDIKRILERSYHLSYPFIFEYQNNYYMIPETMQNRSVELFKCKEFPCQWEFHSTIFESIDAVDTTIVYYDGLWWLFSTMREDSRFSIFEDLYCFYASKPIGENWKPHPHNPIISDVTRGRQAGPIFIYNGNLYRPAQDCSCRYGYGLRIFKITTLNTCSYQEQEIAFIHPGADKRVRGIHSYAYQNNFNVIDINRRRFRFDTKKLFFNRYGEYR